MAKLGRSPVPGPGAVGHGGEFNHETALGTKNSRREQVYSFEMEIGAGKGIEISAGKNYT
ncbi:hypothetical protein [Streptomyces anulatus]|uniref:hypothetical protein n=1 Tax=Streptomyces anulatus TaxID=1892 RepID=UPI0036892F33